jgi:hypothetical protein
MRNTSKLQCVAFLLFVSATTLANPPKSSTTQLGYTVEICSEEINRSEFFSGQAEALQAGEVPAPAVSFIREAAVILEYPSVYDVHSALDPTRDIRSQGGSFDASSILDDLKPFVDEAIYDFVLMYSLQEIPGWIHSGDQWNGAPAKNIGQRNSSYGNGRDAGSWIQLRGTPHMNSIDIYDQWEIFPGSDGGTLIPIHEIGHYWMVNWSRSSGGPRTWRPGDPIAYLAGASYHWSWNWVDTIVGPATMPGIMYSAPLSYEFNEFDLYAMGLMGFSDLSEVSHVIYECAPPDYNACNPGDTHELKVEHLVESLSLEGPNYFAGDGRRMPGSDVAVQNIKTLIVIIKGEDETISGHQESLITTIAANLPDAWSIATWGRSQMSTLVQPGEPTYSIGGFVSGLSGDGLVLQNNNGDNLAVPDNGVFTFAAPLENGETYAVTVSSQPNSPTQTCSVNNSSGTVDNANITNVSVNCKTESNFKINAGLNDAWFNSATVGQGLLIATFPDRGEMFVAWFTYDTERPPENVTALLGEPGHRWLTAQGTYSGDTANLTIYVTEGGVFDAAEPVAATDLAGDGTMTIEFSTCTEGLVTYEITSLGISGEIPIQRLTPDNVPLCEALANP